MLKALPNRLRALKQDKFLRATGVLVGGTAAAQGIGLLALPLLTRLYTPEDFSVLAIYVAILTISAGLTCMRLDAAIPLPERDDEATSLMVLALISALVMITFTGIMVFFFGSYLAQIVGRPEIVPHLWLVPFGIGMMGFYSCFQYMAMRQKAFKLIARTKLTQAIVGLGSQIGLGWMGVLPLGLLLGHALMSGAGVLALALRTLRRSAGGVSLSMVTPSRLLRTLHTYRRFPQFSVAEELTNNTGNQLPILLIASFLVGPEAGLLFIAMRAVGAPMSIVGNAVAQVYYSHAAEYARKGRLAEETAMLFKRLSRTLVVPMLIVGPFAPYVFRVAFGPDWERAGVLVIMMLPWYAFRLIASPTSMVMHVRMRQKLLLLLTIAGLVLRILPLLLAFSLAPGSATLTFAITNALFYGSLMIVFLAVAGIALPTLTRLVLTEMVLWLAVAGASFTIVGVIGYA